ncbi:MbtH family protein [Streptomyces sp. NPDC090022]|uniref:MbtH family protein n=1 Tax=Streptomyces sp. NPDC090022 TaxID=3365920 RepID=UPI003827840E
MNDTTTQLTYLVVANDEEQYSLWEAGRPLPLGWHPQGFEGGKEECLAHIEQVWTDMRPRSLRLSMAG